MGEGGGGGGASEVLLPYIGGSEKLYSQEEGGLEKFDGLYPSLFWVLNFCKNCITFGNCK